MRELPRVNIYDDFYIWFDLEEKKEHYATPLYLYNVKRDRIDPDDETRLFLKLEKDISKTKLNKKKEIIRQPSTIYIHYVESIGAILINFLNADFTTYETAYNTFFYAYGYELVKDYVPYSYTQNDKFIDDAEFKRIIKDIYDTGSDGNAVPFNTKENTMQSTEGAAQIVRETIKYIDKPQRKIIEIRIFFDDGTFEVFSGNK